VIPMCSPVNREELDQYQKLCWAAYRKELRAGARAPRRHLKRLVAELKNGSTYQTSNAGATTEIAMETVWLQLPADEHFGPTMPASLIGSAVSSNSKGVVPRNQGSEGTAFRAPRRTAVRVKVT
jgi:hypothetical protein